MPKLNVLKRRVPNSPRKWFVSNLGTLEYSIQLKDSISYKQMNPKKVIPETARAAGPMPDQCLTNAATTATAIAAAVSPLPEYS